MNETIFWQAFAAVLAANMLTVAFIWGVYSYSKLEQQGREREAGRVHYAAIFAPLLCVLVALMIALNSVPMWLEATLQ